jgi:hypothetical protein
VKSVSAVKPSLPFLLLNVGESGGCMCVSVL